MTNTVYCPVCDCGIWACDCGLPVTTFDSEILPSFAVRARSTAVSLDAITNLCGSLELAPAVVNDCFLALTRQRAADVRTIYLSGCLLHVGVSV